VNTHVSSGISIPPPARDIPIERRLLSFIGDLIERQEIDLIVCSERKGTAVMRALIQEIESPKLRWPWDRVVSTAAVKEYPWSSSSVKRILFFDELVHHGRSLQRAKEELSHVIDTGTEIITAGFAVWNQCIYRPDFSYYASVDIAEYEEIRNDIILMLQRYGSLLLDTEHLELSVKINCGIKEFYSEIARASENGNTFSFLSGTDRLNLTIRKPEILEPEMLKKWVPVGSNVEDVVTKCNVLEKDHSSFSIMPIFYPSTRCVIDEEWISNLPSFINRDAFRKVRPTYIFYIVGLLVSIEVLKGIVAALSDLIRAQKIVLETPRESFTHLKAMFPAIDTDGLWRYVLGVVAESKQKKIGRSSRGVDVRHISEETLKPMSYWLVTQIQRELDERDWDPDCPKGVTWKELMQMAENTDQFVGIDPRWWSVIPDRLIDGGILHTDVAEFISSVGEPWALRIFGPDSEVVAEKLRRQMAVRGARWLPTI